MYCRFPAAHVRVGDTVVLRSPEGHIGRGKVTAVRTCSEGHILWETDSSTRSVPAFWFLGCTLPDELVEVM